jgi:hypothetical protein
MWLVALWLVAPHSPGARLLLLVDPSRPATCQLTSLTFGASAFNMSEEGRADPATTAEVSAAASQSQAEEPVESIEGDDDDEKDGPVVSQNKASGVTEDQWRSMMDVVIAIYDYREEECVVPWICLFVSRIC